MSDSRRPAGPDAAEPDAARMMADIEEILSFGIRQPGRPGDVKAEDWALEAFRSAGLSDVHEELVEMPTWEHGVGQLVVWNADGPRQEEVFEGFPIPYGPAADGIEAELALFDPSRPEEVRGKLAAQPISFIDLPVQYLRDQAISAWDPDGDFDTLVQTLPFGPGLGEMLDPALAAGPAGYVGMLTGLPWDTCHYYVPYDTADRPMPGIWLSRSRGLALQARMEQARAGSGSGSGSGSGGGGGGGGGGLRARLTVESSRTAGHGRNIVGRLPGPGEETVIIGSHHDAPWASAVEDASGMALVLAQARYWASVPEADRPHNLTFLLNCGHMAGGAGIQHFVSSHADELDRVVLEVHLEHAAAEVRGDGAELHPTGQPETRWWFTTTEPQLEADVLDALKAEDLRRSLVIRPDTFSPMPTTDGAYFHPAGVPLVHFLTAPMYLFDAADTIDKIHRPSLEPVSRAAIRIIRSTAGRTAAELRGGVR